jgi:hypothetical protein
MQFVLEKKADENRPPEGPPKARRTIKIPR